MAVGKWPWAVRVAALAVLVPFAFFFFAVCVFFEWLVGRVREMENTGQVGR